MFFLSLSFLAGCLLAIYHNILLYQLVIISIVIIASLVFIWRKFFVYPSAIILFFLGGFL